MYDSLENLLTDESVNLVLIATPNDLRRPLAIAAMEAGKHVAHYHFRWGFAGDGGRVYIYGKFLCVHQDCRWDEDYLTVKEILKEDRLAPIFRIESLGQGAHGIPSNWLQEPE